MKKMSFWVALVILVSLIVVFPASTATISMDNFDGPTQTLVTDVGNLYLTSSVLNAATIGGERDLIVEMTYAGDTKSVRVDVSTGTERYAHAQGSGDLGYSEVQWDGIDGSDALDASGLGGFDLTDSGVNDSFVMGLIRSDSTMSAVITIYNSAGQCVKLSRALPSLPAGSDPEIVVYSFADFTDASPASCATATPAGTFNFSSVGAVVLRLDGTSAPDADATLDWFVTGAFDYGDLPQSPYKTLSASGGSAHFVPAVPNLYFGESVDVEADGQPSALANGDDENGTGDDEDGVSPKGFWDAAGGSVDIDVVGTGCVAGWVDWNNDGNFTYVEVVPFPFYAWDTNELIIANVKQTTGSQNYSFTPGVDLVNVSKYARFRLFPTDGEGNCPAIPTFTSTSTPEVLDDWLEAVASNGEVEDYLWSFGPNAVVTNGFGGAGSFGLMAVMAMGLVAAAGVVVRKRK